MGRREAGIPRNDAHGIAAHIGMLRRFTKVSKPQPFFTPQILNVLTQHRVPATFLVIGAYAAEHPDLIRPPQAVGLGESHKLVRGRFRNAARLRH